MIKAEQESEELSAAERRLLADFVVPSPSEAAEDLLMRRVQLQRQAQLPDELARRRWTRPPAISPSARSTALRRTPSSIAPSAG